MSREKRGEGRERGRGGRERERDGGERGREGGRGVMVERKGERGGGRDYRDRVREK